MLLEMSKNYKYWKQDKYSQNIEEEKQIICSDVAKYRKSGTCKTQK